MKILITGATGFIGNHLIIQLLKNKSNKIVASARNIDKAKEFDWFSKVTFIEFDLQNSHDDLFNFFGKPDKLIHLAWSNLDNYSDLIHIEKNLNEQYRFIKNLIMGGLRDITVTGTCFEYGMLEGCLSEDMSSNPTNSYALAKDTLRKFIIELQKQQKFNYKWIRLFYMYGEGQSKKSLISLLQDAINNKDPEFKMSGGEQLRDFLPVDEVARNISMITSQNTYFNQIINCCSGSPISVKNLVENYLKENKYTIKLNLGYYPYPNYEPRKFWGNNLLLNKIKKEIADNE